MYVLAWLLIIGYIIGFCIGIFYWKKGKKESEYYVETDFYALCAIVFIPMTIMAILFILWLLTISKLIIYVILFALLISTGIAVVYWDEIKEFVKEKKNKRC